MKDWKHANSLFQRRLRCCRRPRVLRSLISPREQKKQPRISFVESRISVSMFFVYQIFCWLLITKILTPGSGRVFSGSAGIWPKYGVGFGKTQNILTGYGIWPLLYSATGIRQSLGTGCGVGNEVLGEENGVRYLSDISSRFRIVVKKEQECVIRNSPSGPFKRASAAQQQTKSVVYVYARVAVWYRINIHSNHFSHNMRSLVLV